MPFRAWFRAPRHVLVLFLSVTCVSTAALAWLSFLLLQQDRALEIQRRQDALEQAADRAAVAIERALAYLQTPAGPAAAGRLAHGVSIVALDSDGASLRAGASLLYYPTAGARTQAAADLFVPGERLEFAGRDLAGAARVYSAMKGPAVIRAGALTRLARVSRHMHDPGAALQAYGELARIDDAFVEGIPASLVARTGRASLFEEMHRLTDLRREAALLQAELSRGRWRLTKAEYEFFQAQAGVWLGTTPAGEADALTRTEALDWLWHHQGTESAVLRRLIAVPSGHALVISGAPAAGGQTFAAIAGPEFLASLHREAVSGGLRWAVTDPEGRAVLGAVPRGREIATRTAAAAGLPWTLHLFAAPEAIAGNASPRRRLLFWVLAVLAVVLGTGTYFVLRAISREMRVVQLQSDFVAAVSHEFRTPLSSVSQISEMLARDRIPSDELRRNAYDVLNREAGRLRQLVEGLLDFGRLESGKAIYHFETVEAGALIRAVVSDFQERVTGDGYKVELSLPAREIYVRADREALARALWNLLDNAVKYSPECRTVWVEVEPHETGVAIDVRDQGLGIPLDEQREIFQKFVRGAESKARRIKGTGIGLAMVRHIVEAHGGEIRLASRPGEGSRFTLLLQAVGGIV